MDSLTQIVLGVAVTHVGFVNKISKKRTILFGAVVGTLPDLDIYIAKFFSNPLTEIEIHRGFSHYIIFFLFLCILITVLVKSWYKAVSVKVFFIRIFFVLLMHLF